MSDDINNNSYFTLLCLLTIHCRRHSIIVGLNFNAKKSFCFAFTPRLFKLALPFLHIKTIPISYVDSVKYLGFTLTGAHKDDNDMLRQMRTLHAGSN